MTDQPARFLFRALEICRTPDDNEWRRILAFADRTQLTAYLGSAPGQPQWVRAEIAARIEKNAERLRRLQTAYREICSEFNSSGVDYALLKGFTHAAFGVDLALRVQYDLDIFCPPGHIEGAALALRRLGYEPHTQRSLSDQHLPPMVKPVEWKWSGDYFDPNIPIAIDLHTVIWSKEIDCIGLSGPDLFWERRRRDYHTFSLLDRAAYAALHAVRHILRGDARPAHVFELACLLDARARDYEFWEAWRRLHDPQLRHIQAVAFCFAQQWFQCALPEAVEREVRAFHPRVKTWFQDFAWSPVSDLIRPNKDVIWLHVALLPSLRDKVRILRRRLIPFHRPGKLEPSGVSLRIRRHVSAITPALASGLRWWLRSKAS
jgi:hypothetical protein